MRAPAWNAALSAILFATCGVGRAADPTPTLAHVRATRVLRCGIDSEQAEYSTSDSHGKRAAFDADLCRAVAVAVLGNNAQIAAKQYPDDTAAMAALTTGEVDLLPTLTDDFSHSASTHIAFTRPVLWDGVGFLLLAASPITRARQLSGKKICFMAETTVEESVRAWFTREHLDFVPFPFQEEGEMQAAFSTGNCGALAGNRTRLAETRATLAQHGKRTRLLPETISKDPLAAAVRDNDPDWSTIVSWVMEALVQAEESAVTQANVRTHSTRNNDPQIRFLLGGSNQIGTALNLDNDWVVRVIQAVGNYGEIYERDLGSGSPLKLPRGNNNLYNHGGAIIALPPK